MMNGMTRRSFLKSTSGALALSLLRLNWEGGHATALAAVPADMPLDYRGWEDIYRQKWTWDHVAKGTHFVNCWYQRACNWNVYVKDGIAFREEQSGTYPQTNPEVPDYNPRGCQKGACYSERMYDAARVRYPLKRAGARGEGKWQRVSWEQALNEIADATVKALSTDGPESIIWDQGTAQTSGCAGVAVMRVSHLLDTPVLDVNTEIGDHHPGAAATCGKIEFVSSPDDLFYSDLILIWGGNPLYTQIPHAHFMLEARYHGAQIITIAPDYNASATHADQWIPVNVASDAALGLAIANVLVEEKLYNAGFVKEQTDLPLLVRTDTHRFLRGSDLKKDGDADTFYVFDQASKQVREAPRNSLALEGVDPALEGEYKATTTSGEVTVTPVFAILRKHLAQYKPEAAAKITGTRPELIRQLARQLGKAKAATCITQSNFSKFYHGLEMERAQILVFALSGQIGRKGAGFMSFPYLSLAGTSGVASASGAVPLKEAIAQQGARMGPEFQKLMAKGYTQEMVIYEFGRRAYARGAYPSSRNYFYKHGGLEQLHGSAKSVDPSLKRELQDYFAEAVSKGWQFVPKVQTRIFFEDGGNVLRRIRGFHRMIDGMLPKLDLLVTLDTRMSNTALYSDYVLPAAAWYEKDDITWATPLSPFSQVITKAANPLAESKPDWAFHCLFMKAVEERAKAQGLTAFKDRAGQERKFEGLYNEFTYGSRYTEEKSETFLDDILSVTTNLNGINWETLKKKGFEPFTALGSSYMNIGNATDIKPNETITVNTWHTQKKQPWPTLTRRMQFYIDHEWYLELGEVLPVHKDLPAMGGNYPLRLTGGHTRWSIHATWRDQKHMLRLNRGEPVAYISREDASGRGIQDGDRIRVFNDVGTCELQAKVAPSLRPGQLVIYHAWEAFQFKGHQSLQGLLPSPINPIDLAGGYFHIQPRAATYTPGSTDRGTRVQVQRVESRAPATSQEAR
jgi:DMSO reductase family type II enzyme molybdopterin subunit